MIILVAMVLSAYFFADYINSKEPKITKSSANLDKNFNYTLTGEDL